MSEKDSVNQTDFICSKGGVGMGQSVRINQIYPMTTDAVIYTMLVEHSKLFWKHINGIDGCYEANMMTLQNDLAKFIKKYRGDQCGYVRRLCCILYKSVLKRMCDLCTPSDMKSDFTIKYNGYNANWKDSCENIPKIYAEVWKLLKKYLNGNDSHIMDDNYWDDLNADTEGVIEKYDLPGIERFVLDMVMGVVDFCEERYEIERKKFNKGLPA